MKSKLVKFVFLAMPCEGRPVTTSVSPWFFAIFSALALVFAPVVRGQTNAPMADVGRPTPPQGPYDIDQTLCTYCASASGTHDAPDSLNYYTDNGANHALWAGQTFTTGTNSGGYHLASVEIKTGGVDDGGGYGNSQIFHLYLYSVAGGTATPLAQFTNISAFVDGDWVQWNLMSNPVTLAPGSTYAYGFGRDSSGSGWAGLGCASGNPYAGGGLAMFPTAGGAITFGPNYAGTFEIGLNAVGAPAVAVSVNPSGGLAGQIFSIMATVTPGLGTMTNVTVNLSAIGGASAASLVLAGANVYTNTFTVPANAPVGAAYLSVTATDTTPLAGAADATFTVLTPQMTTINPTKIYQTIEGFGGATAFYEGWIPAHPYQMEIYTNAFAGLNLSMLRLGNWYRYQTPLAGFDSSATLIVSNASRVLGHPVPVYMSSWSPPAFLKSNGETENGGTLITNSNGGFDYSGFAQYWYDSINAYQSNGVTLTWASIQNEPDFVASYDSCILNPGEGVVNGTNYASYAKALAATYQLLTNLPSPPKLLAPECVHISFNDLVNYAAQMTASSFYGVTTHLYGDGGSTADSFLSALGSTPSVFPGKPHFMTEYGFPDMINTACLIHDCLTVGQDAGFNYWSLVWPYPGDALVQIENPYAAQSTWTNAPPGVTTDSHGWWLTPPYWAMKHFSYFIQPGFIRVGASDTDSNVRSSAYLSPDGLRLVVVLINTNLTAASTMNFNFGSFAAGNSSVYQTAGTNTYAGTNTFLPLGALTNLVILSPQSLTTIVLDKIITVGAASNPTPTNGAPGLPFNPLLNWTPGSNALTHAVYLGTSSNAVANATPASPQFVGIVATNNISVAVSGWGTTNYWRVDEIAYSNTNQGSVWSFSTAPAVQLLSPWQSQDIGGAASQSSAIYSNGVFFVTGSGADIQSSSDSFRYACLTLVGNGAITARVSGVQNVNPWSKAGVMIRASLNSNAANAFIAVTPGNGVTWQYRSSAGGGTSYNTAGGLAAPCWVKLVWSGSTFTGYYSTNDVTWTQQGTTTFTMGAPAYIGLAVTSHNTSDVCTATFDNVTAPGWPLLPGTPGGPTAAAGDAQVVLRWPAVTGASNYNLESTTNNGGPFVVLTNLTSTGYTNTGLINGTTYYYQVSALNIAGQSANSVSVSATPEAPPALFISSAGTNLTFSWPLVQGFSLQASTNLVSGNWMTVTSAAPQNIGGQWQVVLPFAPGTSSTYYRLTK